MSIELSRDDLIAAVTEGVRLAFVEALGKIDLREAIEEGVGNSISSSQIAEAVKNGVCDSFPYSSEITNSIWDATKKAIQDRE